MILLTFLINLILGGIFIYEGILLLGFVSLVYILYKFFKPIIRSLKEDL